MPDGQKQKMRVTKNYEIIVELNVTYRRIKSNSSHNEYLFMNTHFGFFDVNPTFQH